MKKLLVFYIASTLMLVNGGVFTKLFTGTPLVFWRQAIWAIGIISLFVICKRYYCPSIRKIAIYHLLLFFCVIYLSALTYVFYQYSAIRILYAIWVYFAGLPFLIFPTLWLKSGKSLNSFFRFFVLIGVGFSLGLILDYALGGAISIFLISSGETIEEFMSAGRYRFTAEAPTTFSILYCMVILSTLVLLQQSSTTLKKLKYHAFILLYFVGAWFTGARQLVLSMAIVYGVMIFYYIFKVKDNKIHMFFILLIVLIYGSTFVSQLLSDKAYSERYTTDIKEDTRSLSWKRGFDETIGSGDPKVILFGEAVANAIANGAGKTEKIGFHYENTFYCRWIELGLVGVILLLYPVIFVYKRTRKLNFMNVGIISILLSFIITCYISPNGSSTVNQIVLYMIMGLMVSPEKVENVTPKIKP